MKQIKKNQHKQRNFKNSFVKIQVQMLKKSFRRFFLGIHCVIICGSLSFGILSGCGRDVSVLKNGTMEDSFQKEESEIKESEIKEFEAELTSEEEDDNTSEKQDMEQESKDMEDECRIYIDLAGAVMRPGVYSLCEGSRVFEVIALAGGFTKDAYVKSINQAKVLVDGEQIYVYTQKEAKELMIESMLARASVDADTSGGKVNLNLADKDTLMTLDGIGATRADAILQYRMEHGKFRSIEELMQVDGIKEKTYEKIKDCIIV